MEVDRIANEKRIKADKKIGLKAIFYHSCYEMASCWKGNKTVVRRNLRKLKSEKAMREALIHNIKIRVVGFGWKQYKIAWTVRRQDQSLENLIAMLEKIVVEEHDLEVPDKPNCEINKLAVCPVLGTMTDESQQLEAKHFKTIEAFRGAAKKLSKERNERNNPDSMYAGWQQFDPPSL